MQKHIRNYIKYHGIGEQDVIHCEICGKSGRIDKGNFDIHHIKPRSQGGKDNIENLILLCRKCHDLAHSDPAMKEMIKQKYLK